MTIEGYFSDPVYGGNLGMAAWKMIGFPGAYASYYDLVDKHGMRFEGEPRSLAENGRGHDPHRCRTSRPGRTARLEQPMSGPTSRRG